MKTFITLCLVCFAAVSADAQVFRHGHDRGHHRGHGRHVSSHGWNHRPAWHHHRHHHSRVSFGVYGPAYWGPAYVYRPSYAYTAGYPAYGYYGPSYGASYSTGGGSRAATGALLGGIAGAIIGNNSGGGRHNGWEGAAVGAGAGLLLGAIADSAADQRETAPSPLSYYTQPQVNSAPAAETTPSQSAPAPQNVTIINNYYGTTPMSSANKMFGR